MESPGDVMKLRGEVYSRMLEDGGIPPNVSALRLVHWSIVEKEKAVDSGLVADFSCHYLAAMARKTLNICIALEYPFISNRITARKWMLFQPDKKPGASFGQRCAKMA